MDDELRNLERQAACGDPRAAEKLKYLIKRISPKFYYYAQNNVKGIWYLNPKKGIGKNIIIQAYSLDEANNYLLRLVGDNYYVDYCECCGSRWREPKVEFDLDALLEILYYYGDFYVHYLDGSMTFGSVQDEH